MSENDVLMPIHRAIKQGDLPEVTRLIAGDKSRLCMWTPFGTWLHDAASHGRLDIVRWLLSQGMDINAYNDRNERTPVCDAAAEGHVDIVKSLIESGATLDVSDSVRNPLLAAIVGGLSDSHTVVARVLIESGIDTTIRYPNLDNMDAMEYAREWGRSDIVKLLKAKQRGRKVKKLGRRENS